MAVSLFIRWLARILVREYCRRVPILPGRTKLMFHCRRFVSPYTEETPLRSGGKFRVDLTDNIQRQIYFQGYYEPEITDFIMRTLRPGDIFIDIGANTGYFTVLASLLVGDQGAVHSFEPIPQVFSEMEFNASLNSLDNVYLNQIALCEDASEVDIFLPVEGNIGSGSLVKQHHLPGTSIRVEATSLNQYVSQIGIERIRLIKMDIEGGEISALNGMGDVLSSSCAPDVICESVPELLAAAGKTTADLAHIMQTYGYRSIEIDRWNLLFTQRPG